MVLPLAGKKIAVLVETEYIPEEIAAYQTKFPELGATVHLMSRLWNQPSARFVSDVDEVGKELQYLDVNMDFQNADINEYAAVIMAANYTSVRLRYFQPPEGQPISPSRHKPPQQCNCSPKRCTIPRLSKVSCVMACGYSHQCQHYSKDAKLFVTK